MTEKIAEPKSLCDAVGMISVHILYPKTDDSSFDMDYYCEKHMPMLANALGDACTGWGASTVGSGPWAAIGWCTVASKDAWDSAMAEHGAAVMGDVANYTNVTPELVLGEVAH